MTTQQGPDATTDPLVNPWHPETNPVTVKTMGKLLEELGELSSAVSRSLIQGVEELEPVTGKPNRCWLEEELADVKAGIVLLEEHLSLDKNFISMRSMRKIELLRKWHSMA